MDDERRRSWWGWGYEDAAMTDEQVASLAAAVSDRLGQEVVAGPAPSLDDVSLPPPRIDPPAALAHLCRTDVYERTLHAYGRSFRDVVRGYRCEYPHPPDVVARPGTEADVLAILDWCGSSGVAAIPFGGGSSVVGGVEPVDLADAFAGVVSIDLTALDRVLEVDRTSRAARIQAGALGPVLENQLRPEGLTLRHFPQSFEVSSLGGWLATRSGGHYATVYTHIDDLVESMRVVTPTGISESRRLPGSGAGPSHDRMFLGSEGSLGLITEAWMRVQDRPRWKGSAGVRFARFHDGVAAVRALSQSALFPTNCRLLDAGEALVSAGVGDVAEGGALLVLGFESADHPVDAGLERALAICGDNGGSWDEVKSGGREGAVGAWRDAFLRAPYLRDTLIAMGVFSETFETAITWDRFPAFHRKVTAAVEEALREHCGAGTVTCRFTHVYPDGPAPYYTMLAPAKRGHELDQWEALKCAASDAVIAAGGTITHHHAVGRDHRPWYSLQRPEPFAAALRGAKAAVDPRGILNPGVLIDP
jgi:alkyldihydroxyacetonephosphate synthase